MQNFNSYPPRGVDAKILVIQNALAGNLGWDNVNIHGRVSRVLTSDGKSEEPEIYRSATEGKDVYYDDRTGIAGSILFIDSIEHKSVGLLNEAEVKIVFMLNLKSLYPSATYRADAEAQEHAEKLIRRIGTLKEVGILKSIPKIFTGFDTRPIKEYDLQPYHVFAITGKIRYNNSTCN